MEETIIEELLADEEPEFIYGDTEDVSANFIVLLEDEEMDGCTGKVYEQTICGDTLADWVGRACLDKPTFLTFSKTENLLELVKSQTRGKEYTVVLFGNTPMITRAHIKDMLGFAWRKRLNVCRLKKGFIFKNEYIQDADEIYSSLSYGIKSNDFTEVHTLDELNAARETLLKRMFNFHRKNGVIFENEKLINIDANVIIGKGTKIYAGASLLCGSSVGENVIIQEGAVVSNSKVLDDVIIETGAVIKNSIVKTGSVIETRTLVNHSVVGERCRVGLGATLSNTALQNEVTVGERAYTDNVNVLDGAKVGKASVLIGESAPVVIGEQKVLPICTKIVK